MSSSECYERMLAGDEFYEEKSSKTKRFPVKQPASNGDRICGTCNKEDVCMYKAELMQAVKEITRISERENALIDTDIKCKRWFGVVNNYR